MSRLCHSVTSVTSDRGPCDAIDSGIGGMLVQFVLTSVWGVFVNGCYDEGVDGVGGDIGAYLAVLLVLV